MRRSLDRLDPVAVHRGEGVCRRGRRFGVGPGALKHRSHPLHLLFAQVSAVPGEVFIERALPAESVREVPNRETASRCNGKGAVAVLTGLVVAVGGPERFSGAEVHISRLIAMKRGVLCRQLRRPGEELSATDGLLPPPPVEHHTAGQQIDLCGPAIACPVCRSEPVYMSFSRSDDLIAQAIEFGRVIAVRLEQHLEDAHHSDVRPPPFVAIDLREGQVSPQCI